MKHYFINVHIIYYSVEFFVLKMRSTFLLFLY